MISLLSTNAYASTLPSLEAVRLSNKASVQAIQTFYCKVSATHNPASAERATSGEFWKSGDTMRVRYFAGNNRYEYLRQDGRETAILDARQSGGRGKANGSVTPIQSQIPMGFCDVWCISLLSLSSGASVVTLDDYLNRPHNVRDMRLDGSLFVIQITLKSGEDVDLWLDSSANYLVRKIVISYINNGHKMRTTGDVDSFAEPLPGIFFPSRVVYKNTTDDKLAEQSKYEFTSIRANHDLPADAFKLKYVRGMEFLDYFQNKVYAVDEDGHYLAPSPRKLSAPTQPRIVDPASGVAAPSDPVPRGQASVSEEQSNYNFILICSFVSLAAASGIWLVRRRRAR